MDKANQIKNIKIFIKKHSNIEYDVIDLEAEVDSSLTTDENLSNIFTKYIQPSIREVPQ